ncbi:hypothetical protein NM688_g3353 [Phlebia brevispora]|uniref:Uncharacterized protein n=1 Tax=Phlebia brevispora TaxID=194682 RepID=A0ACC1T666_9APHY|nr:hypothetical protein NM688_g3353 [Phlebia brevispora]
MAIDESRKAELLAKKKSQDEHIRESWVRAMEARIVQQNLQKCYRIEGVNHLEKCKHLADRYTEMLRENRIQGYRHIDV